MRLRCQLVTSSKGLLDPPRPPCSKLERWHNPGDRTFPGWVAERLIAPVLKTGRPKGLVSSNLTPSAILVSSLIGDWRLAATGSALPQAPIDLPAPLRTRRRRDNGRRYTSVRVRSELESGDTQCRRADGR